MSNDLMIVLSGASIAALVGGAAVAWWTSRSAASARREATSRHTVDLLHRADDSTQRDRDRQVLAHKLEGAQQELARAVRHVGTLEDQVAAYLRQYAQAKNTLKGEIRLKNSLKAELAAATAQIRALEARVQELEMERTAITGSRRQLSA